MPNTQTEEKIKKLKDQYRLFVRRDTHGVEEELHEVDIEKVLAETIADVERNAYKYAAKELRRARRGASGQSSYDSGRSEAMARCINIIDNLSKK